MGAAFLSKFFSPWIGKTSMKKVVHVSNPTWGRCFDFFPLATADSLPCKQRTNAEDRFILLSCT